MTQGELQQINSVRKCQAEVPAEREDTPEQFSHRTSDTEAQVREPEDAAMENSQTEQHMLGKGLKGVKPSRGLWNIQWDNICILGVLEVGEK